MSDSCKKGHTQGRRALRERETTKLTVAPLVVTDLTSAAVLGLEPRTFREWLVSANVEHTRIGRRVAARADHVVAALSLASTKPEDGTPQRLVDDDQDGQLEDVDDVLAKLGMTRAS